MRRLTVPLAAGLLAAALLAAACAQPSDGGAASPPDHDDEALYAWAGEVADAWSASADPAAWRAGFVPLQNLTTVDGDLDEAQRRALDAGWLRSSAALPAAPPPARAVAFPDGTLDLPLVSAADAYAQVRQGDPPPCAPPPTEAPEPSPTAAGPDTAVTAGPLGDCVALTVTGATLDTTRVRTTRGVATVPAWRFTLDGTPATLVRVAVAPAAVGPPPAPAPTPTNRPPAGELVAAQHLTGVAGARLAYALGVGACDERIEPIVAERPDVVVVGGSVRRAAGVCTEQLLLHEVEVSLAEPLGDRPVFDALTGQPLVLKGG
jgi:hypothetical protein